MLIAMQNNALKTTAAIGFKWQKLLIWNHRKLNLHIKTALSIYFSFKCSENWRLGKMTHSILVSMMPSCSIISPSSSSMLLRSRTGWKLNGRGMFVALSATVKRASFGLTTHHKEQVDITHQPLASTIVILSGMVASFERKCHQKFLRIFPGVGQPTT